MNKIVKIHKWIKNFENKQMIKNLKNKQKNKKFKNN